MKKPKTTYKSLKHKSFRQALIQMLENDFSLFGSGKILELLADNMLYLVEQYMPERTPSGKTLISAISKDAPKGHHRGVKGLPQVPVTLDVYTEDIVNRYANNDRARDIKKDYAIGLFKQAFEQGGVLSSADVAVITKMSAATVSKYVRDYMNECDEIVPTRGFIHDIGPSISHKGIIVGKYLQGVLPDQIARETNHSLQAVERYIKDYERVRICLKQGMDTAIIARATGLSKMLVLKHEELYKQYEGNIDDKNDSS